jgi:hypothetical protein
MPHLISNLYSKTYTPFTAKLAPKNLWNRPVMGRKPAKTTRFGADPTVKAMWRFIRTWVGQNAKLYYTYVLVFATLWYNFMFHMVVNVMYIPHNQKRSLAEAIRLEKEWEKNKPAEEEDDDEEEE